MGWIIGTKPAGAFQHRCNAIAEREQREQRECGKAKPGEPLGCVFAACELAVKPQHDCGAEHDQHKDDECPAVEMKAQQCAAIGASAGNNMDEDLAAGDHGAGKGADDHDGVMTRPRPKSQIECKSESCD